MKKVLILYKFLPHYRIEFFNKLKEELASKNIELSLVYSKLKNKNSTKNDERDLPWAIYKENKSFHIGSTELIWQPCLSMAKEYDLVIAEQANSLLINYLFMIMRRFGFIKFAFWGHGLNLQDNSNSLRNKFKRLLLNQCDWWFAYTSGVKNFLMADGINQNKITIVQNAIDTKKLKQLYEQVTIDNITDEKEKMGISGENICLYCGGIYPEKRIDFLIDACKMIKEEIHDFNLIIIGGGPDSYITEKAAKEYPWIHYLGPKFDQEKVLYFRMSSLMLMPGLVGLGILDTFATQTPIVTTNYLYHSPEIEYLKNGTNGIMTENNLDSFSTGIISLLKDKSMLDSLKMGCKESTSIYTVETMAKNFANGVSQCLGD